MLELYAELKPFFAHVGWFRSFLTNEEQEVFLLIQLKRNGDCLLLFRK